jgi:hypothetical protein
MPTPVEKNLMYSYQSDRCYGVLKEEVIPAFSVELRLGYLSYTMRTGSIGLTIIEDDWRANKLIAKMESRALVNSSWGPPIKMYSRSTGPDTTMVEMVADAAKFYDGKVLNLGMDIVYKKIPIYSWLSRKIVPDYYFDQTKILDTKKLEEESFRDGLGKAGLSYIFQKVHEMLEKKLAEQG